MNVTTLHTPEPEPEPEPWYTAAQLAEEFPHTIGRLDGLALHRLSTLASGIARGRGIATRSVQQPHHRYRAVQVSAYPQSVWVGAHGKVTAPAGLEPRPTVWNGTRFRSRAEARTAVWITGMGWDWEYEPAHYELPSGRYLPDFRVLIEGDWTWFEVKSPHVLGRGRDPRWSQVARFTRCDIVVMYGLWRPVPFADSGPPRMFRGAWEGAYAVRWSEMIGLFPESAANVFLRQKLIRAYQDAADETFDADDGLSFAA